MIKRVLFDKVQSRMWQNKAIILLGPRQAGKTTFLKAIAESTDAKTLYLDCDQRDVRANLTDVTSVELKNYIRDSKLILIDEAQRVHNIGLSLKLITDNIPGVQLIVTGSSALELANEIKEPLTGRKFEYYFLPLSTEEMINYKDHMYENRMLNHRLIFGLYPAIATSENDFERLLYELSDSYLYKDLFTYQDIRKPDIIVKLLEALAWQVGQEVSFYELSQMVGADFVTVERYVDLLEKAFIIFRLRAFSRNLRNEIKKGRKIYFYDNGIRNALIGNFQPVGQRSDIGALWENFMVSERLKYLKNYKNYAKTYFWRTNQQQEIDYIEMKDGQFSAYEFKWNPKRKARFSKTFTGNYDVKKTMVVTPENYIEFLTNP